MPAQLSRRNVLWFGGVAVTVVGGGVVGAAALRATVKADVVVYGATSAGIVAAIQARRMGRTAVVVEPGTHIGGLTTGGLSSTDAGSSLSIGGIAGEFYRRIYAKYTGTKLSDVSPKRFTFEPHVAAEVLADMIHEAEVQVHTGARLHRVHMSGKRIDAIQTESGAQYAGRVFIDASYEGDLLDRAGVSWIVGREANSTYDETYNGVRLTDDRRYFLTVSPYRKEWNASSGLLPGIARTAPPNGTGDDRVQAYNFRMCLTRAADRVPFPKPPGYDPADYELARRLITSGYVNDFFTTTDIGNDKVDANNVGPFSTDFVGANYRFPAAGHRERESLIAEHRTYQQGLLWFLANDPQVPEWMRKRTSEWGMAPDEFTSTGNWSPQIYVREARRMRSAYVMTEHDCLGKRTAKDAVGLGSYMMDSHVCQRVVYADHIANEGAVEVPVSRPYPISYRAIVPNKTQCTNLLVPVCLSASHTAYGSIRMEPVFMILAQSAATAAILAIESDIDVQQVDYPRLAARLQSDGQILLWPTDVREVIIDSTEPGVSRVGAWTTGANREGYYGAGYEHDNGSGEDRASITFRLRLPSAAIYRVYLRWASGPDRASNVPVDIRHADGWSTVVVDQRRPSGEWASIGYYRFAAKGIESITLRTDGTDGIVVADSVRLVPV